MTQKIDRPIHYARWWRIIPPAILVYIFSFMDRTNIGMAMAGGMNDDLAMTASMSGWAAGIFFGVPGMALMLEVEVLFRP
ncbi:MAG: hypothetical protein WCA81_12745 [Rhizomicrobium sp.]